MTKAPITSMAFYHPHGLVSAYEQASTFAAGGGRIATLPDILEARLRSDQYGVAWSSYFTTMTSEFYGHSKGGVPLVVVAHGNGPMADLAFIQSAYAYEFKDKSRNRRGGRISQQVFDKLVDGGFGDVHVVEFNSVLMDREFPFGGRTAEELLAQPLWVARMGGLDLASRYATRHAGMALADLMQNQNSVAQGKNPHPGKILQMGESNNSPYTRVEGGGAKGYKYVARPSDDGMAQAHLLSIGQLVNMSYGGPDGGYRTHLQSDVSVHDWTDGVRLAAVRPGYEFGEIHRGFDSDTALRKARNLLWQEDAGEMAASDGFYVLTAVGKDWFTQHPKVGEAMDVGQPKYAVVEKEEVGKPVLFTVKAGGYHGFFRYAIADVRRLAPPNANAYVLAGAPGFGDGHHMCPIQFYRVTVDRSRRLPTTDEVYKDVDLLLKVAAAA